MNQVPYQSPGEVFVRPSIPDHELLECIGQGSYGQVWRARNLMGSYRAVKVIWRKAFREDEPFQRELRGISKFEPISRSHPAFVGILHLGQNIEEGYFYYVMELGDELDDHQSAGYPVKTLDVVRQKEGPLPVEQVLKLGLRLSDALGHLHEARLLHRDIKPANIIFVEGLAKLADIGLVAEQRDATSIVGTPGFIPPEGPGSCQADIYALGKVLYECLTGLDRSSFPEIPESFEQHPERNRFLEINEVIVKACHPNLRDRYQTARQLHAELSAVESGVSIARLRRMERRWVKYRRLTRIAAAVMAVAATAFVLVSQEHNRVEQDRQRRLGGLLADTVRAVDAGEYAEALHQTAQAQSLMREPREQAIGRLRFGTLLGQMPKLTLLQSFGLDANACDFSPDGRRYLVAHGSRNAEIRSAETGELLVSMPGPRGRVLSLMFSEDGSWVAAGAMDGTARVWDSKSGRQLAELPHSNTVGSVHFHSDGHRLATGSDDGWVRIWDWPSGRLIHQLGPFSRRVECVRFSHTGDLLASTSNDNLVQIWNSRTGQRVGEVLRHPRAVFHAAWSPDDSMLIASCEDGGAYVWSLTTWSKVIPPLVHERAVRRAEFSPDGRYILTAGWDNVLQLWNGKTGARAGPILRHSSPIMGASISFDGRRIMTSCTDGTLRIWDLAGQTIPEWLTADPLSPQAHYSVRTNGNCLEMYSLGRNASPLGSLKTDQPIKRFFLSDQSPHIVTASLAADQSGETNYSVGVWDGATGKRCSPLVAVKEVPSCVALDAADQSLVLSSGNSVRIAALASGLWRCPTLELDEKVRGLAFDPRGRRLAVWTEFNVHLIDALNGKALVSPLRHERSVSKVLFSRAEDWILTCTADGAIRPCYAQVWNTRTGAPVGRRLWHEDGVKGAAWVTDGQTAVTVGEDGLGRIWDVRQSRQVASELKHRHEISDVVVSDDASLIATASWDKTFRLWDAATALPVSPRISLPYELQRVRFTPASGGLVAEEFDGGAWRFPTTPARWSNAVLDGLAALLNGKALGRNTEDQFHAAAALELQWRKMKTELPELFQVTPAEIVAWHRLQARYCFLAGDQSGERLHVNFLLQQDPNDAYGLRRLARLNEIQGRLAR